jgi:hypothetical protein
VYHRLGNGFSAGPEDVMRERAETALEDPQAKLERALIEEFLQTQGCSLSSVSLKSPGERQALLVQAAQYAAVRLAEIDARAAYIHQIHGDVERA